MSKHIFWISSYPKSGNTLIRAILTGLLFSDNGIVDFKSMRNISLFETARRLNFIKKINKEDFYNLGDLKVLSKYWQQIQVSQELKEIVNQKGYGFLKTHSCLVSLNKNFFTNENLTKGYIYIIRDPRDLSVSWANHSDYSIDKSIDFLCNPLSVVRWINKSQFSELPKDIVPMQFLSSWSEHVKSWTENNLQVPYVIKGMENLPDEPTNIYFYNHIAKNYENTLANGHSFSIDSHFISAKILFPKYGDGGQRIARQSRNTEFMRYNYYENLDYIFVHTPESDYLKETSKEKKKRKEKLFVETQDIFNQNRPLVIAPEGTNQSEDNKTPNSPGEFKPGAFLLANKLDPEPKLVPIALANFDYSISKTIYAAVIKKTY
ncbi:sulfotransferase domain-containing protein [Alphaproteobacteria bacterium]|nr:sulfotransferase domain-containing protein [Alphaproteobacteria bacterium]